MDWSRLVSRTAKCLHDFVKRKELNGSKSGAEPCFWSSAHESERTAEGLVNYELHTTKRVVIDSTGQVVVEWANPEIADFLACVDPVTVMSLIRSMESMASIIAEYRNKDKMVDFATKESVLHQMLMFHMKNVDRDFSKDVDWAEKRNKKRYTHLTKEDQEERQRLLNKVYLDGADRIWLLTPEERQERASRSERRKLERKSRARPRGSRSRPEGGNSGNISRRGDYPQDENPSY